MDLAGPCNVGEVMRLRRIRVLDRRRLSRDWLSCPDFKRPSAAGYFLARALGVRRAPASEKSARGRRKKAKAAIHA